MKEKILADQTYHDFKEKWLSPMDKKHKYLVKAEKIIKLVMNIIDAEFDDSVDRHSCYHSVAISLQMTLINSNTNPEKIKNFIIDAVKSLPIWDESDSDD